jgi:hypothetical protein
MDMRGYPVSNNEYNSVNRLTHSDTLGTHLFQKKPVTRRSWFFSSKKILLIFKVDDSISLGFSF